MPRTSKTKWICISIAALAGLFAVSFAFIFVSRAFSSDVVSQLQSTKNIKELLKTNQRKVNVTTAFGDFKSLSSFLKGHDINSLKLRFSWSDPEKLEFTCVNGKMIVESDSSNEKLRKFDDQNCKQTFSELNRVWNSADVKLMIGGDGMPLSSHDQLGNCRLMCLISTEGSLAFIRTRGEKIVDWTVRDYSIDRVYASDSKGVIWP